MRTLRNVILCAILVALAGAAHGSVECAGILIQGRTAMDEHRFAAAAIAFDEFASRCKELRQDPGDHPFEFYMALARHLDAIMTVGISADRRAQLLRDAERLYTAALSAAPKDRAALTNLAIVYVAQEKRAQARDLFERGLAAGGSGSPWYLATYGRFLIQEGEYAEAQQYLNRAREVEPYSLEVECGMLELVLSKDGPDFAVKGLQEKAVADAEHGSRIAIELLSSPNWTSLHKQLVFAIAVSAMAVELTHAPAARDGLVDLLQRAQNEVSIAAGASELKALLSGRETHSSSFGWWTAKASSDAEVDAALWTAFRAIALAAGMADATSGDYPRALAKYYLILKVEHPRVSPDAVLRVAELYTEVGDAVAFRDLVETYDRRIAELPLTNSLKTRFDYHRELVALGDALLESRCLGKTSSDSPTTSTATPPFDRSICIAIANTILQQSQKLLVIQSEHSTHAPAADPLRIDGGAYAAMARSYALLGALHDAATARYTAAETYAQAGRKLDAYHQLESIQRDDLRRYMSADEAAAYQRLFESISTKQKP